MREILPNELWIAGRSEANNITAVLNLGVCAIVDLAANEPPLQYPRDIVNCRFPLVDSDENSRAILRSAILTTTEFIKSGVPTLVACSAGMSRSPAIAAAAIAHAENLSLEAALLKVAGSGPHDISTSLWHEIGLVLPPTVNRRFPQPSNS